MKREAHRRRTQRPQAEHRLPRPADPEERSFPLLELEREGQTDHVAINSIERSRSLTVKVRFEQADGFEQVDGLRHDCHTDLLRIDRMVLRPRLAAGCGQCGPVIAGSNSLHLTNRVDRPWFCTTALHVVMGIPWPRSARDRRAFGPGPGVDSNDGLRAQLSRPSRLTKGNG
jgi:hypothetical protein